MAETQRTVAAGNFVNGSPEAKRSSDVQRVLHFSFLLPAFLPGRQSSPDPSQPHSRVPQVGKKESNCLTWCSFGSRDNSSRRSCGNSPSVRSNWCTERQG